MDEKQEKYQVSFYFDWGFGWLWSTKDERIEQAFGIGEISSELPLSDATRQKAEQIYDWYAASLNWDYPPDPGPWRQEECDRFRQEVRAFFVEVQQDLGEDFELIYAQYEPDEDPDLDEYLKDPKNFRLRRD